jgi:hypothetical protein
MGRVIVRNGVLVRRVPAEGVTGEIEIDLSGGGTVTVPAAVDVERVDG